AFSKVCRTRRWPRYAAPNRRRCRCASRGRCRGCASGWKKWGCAMRDERVAELMKQAMADKRPREGWEQRVLATASPSRSPPVPWKWVLLLPAASFVVVTFLGYYMYSQHQTEKAQQEAIIAQKQREAESAKHEAERQQLELASMMDELNKLQDQLRKATTD